METLGLEAITSVALIGVIHFRRSIDPPMLAAKQYITTELPGFQYVLSVSRHPCPVITAEPFTVEQSSNKCMMSIRGESGITLGEGQFHWLECLRMISSFKVLHQQSICTCGQT